MDARELTRDEKKKIRSLVTGMCANYDRESGLCLPLDCGCFCFLLRLLAFQLFLARLCQLRCIVFLVFTADILETHC